MLCLCYLNEGRRGPLGTRGAAADREPVDVPVANASEDGMQ